MEPGKIQEVPIEFDERNAEIFSALYYGDVSGPSLRQLLEGRWKTSLPAFYNYMARLEETGCIDSHVEEVVQASAGKNWKVRIKVYRITKSGRDEFERYAKRSLRRFAVLEMKPGQKNVKTRGFREGAFREKS
jgi:DNA-binding PadR family transcriptional regulator